MTTSVILLTIFLYFSLLLFISYLTTRKVNKETFYTGDRKSPWYLVAFGMIGASLSGITFISIPGTVASKEFSYLVMCFGYVIGYFIIAYILLPIYYKLNLISIYSYLEKRLGVNAYKTGATFFLISRVIGASLRIYLAANVLQLLIFNSDSNLLFVLTVAVFLLMIWLYTVKGGIKTVVWTDTIQTGLMLLSMAITIYFLIDKLGFNFTDIPSLVSDSGMSGLFIFDDIKADNYWGKSLLGGVLVAVAMTGLDQDMMQKNLTCKNLKSAQTNMTTFSIVLVFINLAFLVLGCLLFLYASRFGISIDKGDAIFAVIAGSHLGEVAGIIFLLGIIAAAFSSADSAVTSLTTSFSFDFLQAGKNELDTKKRNLIHLGFSIVILIVAVIFKYLNNDSVVWVIFKAAGYTYGPILGLFAFGIISKDEIKDRYVYIPAFAAPIICYILNTFSTTLFYGYQLGYELLLLNALLTYIGCQILTKGTQTTFYVDEKFKN